MPWSDVPNAGFCPAGADPWLPITPDLARVNVQSQLDDPRSMLNLTRRLLALRRSSPALTRGSYRPVDWPGLADACYLFLREAAEERLLVALNFSDASRRVALPDGMRARPLLSTRLDRDRAADLDSLDLRPNEGLILGLG